MRAPRTSCTRHARPRATDGAIEEARRQASGDSFRLAIEALDGNTLVGSLNTVAPAPRAGRFGYGLAIGREFQRRGYGREAITLLLGYVFGVPGEPGGCRYNVVIVGTIRG